MDDANNPAFRGAGAAGFAALLRPYELANGHVQRQYRNLETGDI
jgi:hypothetical protein